MLSKNSKKKESNVYTGIVGFATFCYSLWNYMDTTKNPSENEELDKVNKNIAVVGGIVGAMEIVLAFMTEAKERKEAEEAKKELKEIRKKA